MNTWPIYSMGSNRKAWLLIVTGCAALVAAAVMGICLGSGGVGPREVLDVVLSGDKAGTAYSILMHVRLPRVLGAILAGSALSVSGAVIQAVMNNPLASPNIIGVNSGAGFFVLLAAAWFPSNQFVLAWAAFAGALLACVIILAVSGNASRMALMLAGFAVSSLFGAGMNSIMIFYPDAYMGAGTFLVGGLSALTLKGIAHPAIHILLGLALAMLGAKDMNVLALGADTAKSLGMRVKLSRLYLICIAAFLAGAAVSFAGLIGFVGLVVPHAVRFVVGNDNRLVIPASILFGAVFVTICDLMARTVFSPYEVPVGILMAFIGCPFFIFLILRNKRKHYD